jgi:hypothetical protein
MAKSGKAANLFVEDISARPTILLSCSGHGFIVANRDITFKVPAVGTPNAGRIILASVQLGTLKPTVDTTNHRVCLRADKSAKSDPVQSKLLIRIPIGVNIFQITTDDDSLLLLYYETADGLNVVPVSFPLNKDADQNQVLPELVLAVSPVPPRDASKATADFDKRQTLNLKQLNIRRDQMLLEPLMAPANDCKPA